MVLSFLGGGSLSEVLARRKTDKAIDQLRAEIKAAPRDTRTKLQLADLLVEAGRGKDAVPILLKLAEDFAREGAAAKAISTLKKAQKAQPGRSDIAIALSKIIQKNSAAPAPAKKTVLKPIGQSGSGMMFEMEEIELDVRAADPVDDDAVPAGDIVAPTQEMPRGVLPPPASVQAEVTFEAVPTTAPPPPAVVEVEVRETAPLPPPAVASGAVAGSAGFPHEPGLLDDLLDTIEDVLAEAPVSKAAPMAAIASPLFSEFTSDELVAVIAGLNLLSFVPGDILITEGESGDSLFVVTSGEVKAFVKRDGRHRLVREMGEGSFFGEISILSGKARTATVTAKSAVEVLVLDRATLDSICLSHPGVRTTLQRFADERQKASSQ